MYISYISYDTEVHCSQFILDTLGLLKNTDRQFEFVVATRKTARQNKMPVFAFKFNPSLGE